MKHLILGLIVCFSLVETVHAEKSMIFPKNDKWIGVGFLDDGISQATFTAVLAKIIDIYNPIVASHGFKLQFNQLWDDGTVNSDTDTEGDTWVINSYGGLARYNGMTADGYAAVACHELGHHLGGAPQFSDGSDMSVEGEADYHVGTKCLRKYFAADDNVKMMESVQIDPLVLSECSGAFAGDANLIAICERGSIAGFVVANILRDLDQSPAIAYNTPDPSQVDSTNEDHPAAQCRLDTYFNSSLCTVSSDVEFSDTDPAVGGCMTGHGIRPRCWFQPDTTPPPPRHRPH